MSAPAKIAPSPSLFVCIFVLRKTVDAIIATTMSFKMKTKFSEATNVMIDNDNDLLSGIVVV